MKIFAREVIFASTAADILGEGDHGRRRVVMLVDQDRVEAHLFGHLEFLVIALEKCRSALPVKVAIGELEHDGAEFGRRLMRITQIRLVDEVVQLEHGSVRPQTRRRN